MWEDGLLRCVECRCRATSSALGCVRCDDPDPDIADPPAIALYWPPCAAAEFGHRAERAAEYT